MRIPRRGRIGLAEADRLVTGEPAPPEHRGLSFLLAAAAAAPLPEELADEQAAISDFARARRDAGPTVPAADRRSASVPAADRRWLGSTSERPSRARVPRPRMTAVRVAAGLVVAMTGGTAFAAATGSLPSGFQQQAHQLLAPLGVPAPSTGVRPSSIRPHAAASASTGAGQPLSGPTPTASDRPTAPASPETTALCRAWETAQKNPHGKPMTAQARRALAAAAGGEQNIAAFCARVLAGQPGQATPSDASTPSPAAATAGRTHPGDDKGGVHASGRPGKTRNAHPNG